ncbi:hypothetical protein KIM372_09680 [Bombiscardovia nodaiensis]|uniref:Uncharacterized protein n=1 Tax=Bombiscardovia nodaiensis TaxID=2932181 RepID=A0ABN6SE52_9BIFI|nr:hypothetical protein KIM372_09680 [Bombiscardovia nodaiensis]
MYRTFDRQGQSYVLAVGQPEQEDEDLWWTRISLRQGPTEVWTHRIAGIDGVQSLLLALDFSRRRPTDMGGFTFLGDPDLRLVELPEPQ